MAGAQTLTIRVKPEIDQEAADRLARIIRRLAPGRVGLRPSRFPRSPIR